MQKQDTQRLCFIIIFYQQVEDMAERVLSSFKETLAEASWLDEASRARAIAKVEKTVVLVGYPEAILNSTLVDGFYSFVSKRCPVPM